MRGARDHLIRMQFFVIGRTFRRYAICIVNETLLRREIVMFPSFARQRLASADTFANNPAPMEQPPLDELRNRSLPDAGTALLASRSAILARWRDEVTQILPMADELTRKQLEDSLPDLLDRIAAAITYALERTEGATRLLVENTAGAGRTMGRTPAEVAGILERVPKALRARTGYGLDTCHLFASGFAINESAAAQAKILDDFEAATGEKPGFFHLNDSQGALGSNKDRHALIGQGEIGAPAFGWLLRDPRSAGIPCVLETPQELPDVADDDASADPWDVRMIELLRRLEAGG